MKKSTYLIGIDPGLAKTGWGVIVVSDRNKIALKEFGCITTKKKYSFACRLDKIYKEICKLNEKFKPKEAAVEKIFFAANKKTAIDVAQARGVVLLALNHSDIKISEYTPLEIKQAVVGYGKAEKKQVMFMVKQFLNMREDFSDHAADALAAAICHTNSRIVNKLREQSG